MSGVAVQPLVDSQDPASSGLLTLDRRRGRPGVWVFGASLVFSLWLWRDVLFHLGTRALGGGSLDPGLFIWWMNWVPYALVHGLDPLRSTYLDAPSGVSAMWNSSVVALGALFTPVTLLFGPVVSFNIACILGPPLSSWTAFAWLRRHVLALPAAIGAAVFAFSPFVIAHSHAGHLNFTWLFLLPVILMLSEDLLWRSPRPMWPQAPLLGLVIPVQLLISSEALLITGMACVALVLVVLVERPRFALRRFRVTAPAALVVAATAGLLCLWPLIEQFGGRRAIHEPVHAIGSTGGSPVMLVRAPGTLAFHSLLYPPGHLTAVENGLYIGWPLLALLAATVVVLFRRRGVVLAGVAVACSVVLQLEGTHWHLFGLSIPMPLNLMQRNSAIVAQIQPGRFAILTWFAIAWLVAVALDAIITRSRRRWWIPGTLLVTLCLLPLFPGNQAPIHPLPKTPTFFTTSLSRRIPNGSTVMIAPMATVTNSAGETWQIDTGMRFRQLGGYMLHAVDRHGSPSFNPSAPALTELFGIQSRYSRPYRGKVTTSILDAARAELRSAHASLFIVGYSRYGEAAQLSIARQLFGRPADQQTGGVAIWNVL